MYNIIHNIYIIYSLGGAPKHSYRCGKFDSWATGSIGNAIQGHWRRDCGRRHLAASRWISDNYFTSPDLLVQMLPPTYIFLTLHRITQDSTRQQSTEQHRVHTLEEGHHKNTHLI